MQNKGRLTGNNEKFVSLATWPSKKSEALS